MKNPIVFYAIIAIGVIALAAGVFFMTQGGHPARSYGSMGIGALLVIAGIAAMFVLKPKAAAK
jgi:hypothetical protein